VTLAVLAVLAGRIEVAYGRVAPSAISSTGSMAVSIS
jgi:hypothetical protein